MLCIDREKDRAYSPAGQSALRSPLPMTGLFLGSIYLTSQTQSVAVAQREKPQSIGVKKVKYIVPLFLVARKYSACQRDRWQPLPPSRFRMRSCRSLSCIATANLDLVQQDQRSLRHTRAY